MRCKPIERPSQIFGNFEDYLIIAYKENTYQSAIETRYLVLNDDFLLQYVDSTQFCLTDSDKSNFIQVQTKDTHYKLYFDKDYLEVFNKSLTQSDMLEFNFEIWDRTWLAKSLRNNGIELNETLTNAIVNEQYKLSLIEGFLMFANEYINFGKDSDAFYEITFYYEFKDKTRLRFEKENFKIIEQDKIYAYLVNIFESYIFNGKEIENWDGVISDKVVRKIYLLIDCIFVDGVNAVYTFNEGPWTSLTIFEYKDKYYVLDFTQSD